MMFSGSVLGVRVLERSRLIVQVSEMKPKVIVMRLVVCFMLRVLRFGIMRRSEGVVRGFNVKRVTVMRGLLWVVSVVVASFTMDLVKFVGSLGWVVARSHVKMESLVTRSMSHIFMILVLSVFSMFSMTSSMSHIFMILALSVFSMTGGMSHIFMILAFSVLR